MQTERIILFDGVCNLCNWSVQYVIKHDPGALFTFATLQGAHGQNLLKQYGLSTGDMDTFVLIQDNKAYTRSNAALKVAVQLKGMTRLLYGFIIVPAFIRDWVYKLVAKKRYSWFGKRDECMIPTPSLEKRFLN